MAKADSTYVAVVCDAGPLIHLDEVGCLDLLSDFRRVLVPDSVWKEVERYRPGALEDSPFRIERITPPSGKDPEIESLSLLYMLHQGEKDALLLLRHYPDALLLTDDTAARLATHSIGREARGSLGLLARAVRKKLRTAEEVIAILKSLPEKSTLHVKTSLLQEIIRQIRHPS